MASRVSTNQIFTTGQDAINQARERTTRSMEKSATLKELTRPSDDPAAWRIAGSVRDDSAIRETLTRDAELGKQYLSSSDTVLAGVQENVQRAHELALSVASSGSGFEGQQRGLVGGEMRSLFNSTVQLANTRLGDRTLFGGRQTDGPAFDPEGNYLGDKGSIDVEIARGLKVGMNISGNRVFKGETVRDGVDIIRTMRNLAEGMEKNDIEKIRGCLDDLGKANEQLSTMRSELGGRLAAIARAVETETANGLQAQEALSHIQDADAAKVFSDLARDQTVLQSSLSATQKVLAQDPTEILFK